MKNSNYLLVLVIVITLLAFSFTGLANEKIEVPLSAVKESKYGQLNATQLTKEEVSVPRSWIKDEWLKEHESYVEEQEKQNEDWTKKWGTTTAPEIYQKEGR